MPEPEQDGKNCLPETEKLRRWREKIPGNRGRGDRIIHTLIFCKIILQQRGGARTFREAEKLYLAMAEDPELTAILHEGGLDKELQAVADESCELYLRSCREDDSYGRKFFRLVRMKADEVAEKAGFEVYRILLPFFLECRDTAVRLPLMRALHSAYGRVFTETADKWAEYLPESEAQRVSLLDILSKMPAED